MARLDTSGIEIELLQFLDGKDLLIRANPILEQLIHDAAIKENGDVGIYAQHGGKTFKDMLIIEVSKECSNTLLYTARDISSKQLIEENIDGKIYIRCNVPVMVTWKQ